MDLTQYAVVSMPKASRAGRESEVLPFIKEIEGAINPETTEHPTNAVTFTVEQLNGLLAQADLEGIEGTEEGVSAFSAQAKRLTRSHNLNLWVKKVGLTVSFEYHPEGPEPVKTRSKRG